MKLSGRRSLLILVIGTTLLLVVLYQAAKPLQRVISERYMARGDSLLLDLKFSEAQTEYDRAIRLDSQNIAAMDRLQIAQSAVTDIFSARNFFFDHGKTDLVNKIDSATTSFNSAKAALAAGVGLYNQQEYRFARYPLENALKFDPNYPEAWHYLALTYDQLAKEDNSYLQKAADARKKRDLLTPLWINQ